MAKPIEGFATDTRHAQDVFDAPEPTLFALRDDSLRAGGADAREPNELLGPGLVDVDPRILLDTRGPLIRHLSSGVRARNHGENTQD
jgi:hypothetical protein